MAILALDLATTTGWASHSATGIDYGSETFKGALGPSLSAYLTWLEQMIERWGSPTVVFETPWIGAKTHQQVARKLQGMAAIAELTAHRLDCTAWEANTQRVVKHFLGSAPRDRETRKRLVMERCAELGWRPQDDNAADALAILAYAREALAR